MPSSTYTVRRSVTIDAPPQAAFEQIINFRNWRNWSAWEVIDPELRRTYVGEECGEGAAYTWSGNRRIGSGSMKIVQTEEPARVEVDVVFERPLAACCNAEFAIDEEDGGSRVTWTMTGPVTPTVRMRTLFRSVDEWIGQDLERSLGELKYRLEERSGPDGL